MKANRRALMEPVDFDPVTLLGLAEHLAEAQADGCLTLMRSSEGWKVMIGTPGFDAAGREEVSDLDAFGSLEAALADLIVGQAPAGGTSKHKAGKR